MDLAGRLGSGSTLRSQSGKDDLYFCDCMCDRQCVVCSVCLRNVVWWCVTACVIERKRTLHGTTI
uniref:Uncharacterized protein n=1 Tax=Myoviridae sp. ctByu2 TaxID=2827668 RepID=A0A8S5S9R9_9CAUD|nr:MAG TPA: hypothetical protein [Myoviridae sp. ctByu2]